jgi:hypothetical protein
LALAYVYIVNWIPFIYVAFLATAGFGFGIGAAVAWGAKVGKMRNMSIAKVVGGLTALIAIYFAWAFDPMARFPQQIDMPFWDMEMIWEYMKAGYADGFWSIGGNGGEVTGPFLAIVWIAEAGLVVGIASWAVGHLLGEQPFCEETNQWTKVEKGVARLSLENDDEVESKVQQLMSGDIDSLKRFYRTDINSNHLQLDVATCDECPTCKYVTVRMIVFVANNKGEVTKQETKLLVNLQVTEDQFNAIRSAGCDRPTAVDDSMEEEVTDVDERISG